MSEEISYTTTSKLSIEDFKNYCPVCVNYEKVGVCSKIHSNVKDYPKKFIEKCGGEYFILQGEKIDNPKQSKEINSDTKKGFFKKVLTGTTRNISKGINSIKNYQEELAIAAKKEDRFRVELEDELNHSQTKNCPLCGEEIATKAIKCKYCREFLGDMISKKYKKKRKTSISNILFGLLIVLGLPLLFGSNPTEEEHFRKINYSLSREDRTTVVSWFGTDWKSDMIKYYSYGFFSLTKFESDLGGEVITFGIWGNVDIIN